MLIQTHLNGGNLRGLPKARPLSGGDAPKDGPPPGDKLQGHGKQAWLGGHIGLEGGENVAHKLGAAKSGLVGLKTKSHQAASDAVDAALHPAREVGSAAPHLSSSLSLVSGALGLASGCLGVFMLGIGARDLRQGLAQRNAVHSVEGANTILVGVRSLAAGVNLAAHVFPAVPGLASAGHFAHSTLAPLGILHGAVDVGLGLYEVSLGLRQDNARQVRSGLLEMGTGAALAAAAAGGGLPALLTAGALLAGKVAHSIYYPAHPDASH